MNVRLPGQYYDAETELSYNYYRYYDSDLGRYITSDLIGLRGGVNTYLYALANPVIYIDQYGLITGNAGVCAGATVAFFAGLSGGICTQTGTDGKVCTYAYVCVRLGAGPFAGVGTFGTLGVSSGTDQMSGPTFGVAGDVGFGGTASGSASVSPNGAAAGRGGPGLGFGLNIGLEFCWLELIGCECGE